MDRCNNLDLLINGEPLTAYGGKTLLDYSIGPTPMDSAVYQGVNRTNWTLLKNFFGLRPVTLTIVYAAPTLHQAKVNRSRVNSIFANQCELFIPGDGFYYTVYCKDFGTEERIGEGDGEAKIKSTYSFEGIRHGEFKSVTIPAGGSVWCDGTMPYTACRLTVTVEVPQLDDYILGGAAFSNVLDGDVLCFDGITGAVTKNGQNYANKTQWVHFPALVPGENVIESSDPVLVEFAPAYI